MYLFGFYWCKNLNFFGEKWGDEAVDYKMDLSDSYMDMTTSRKMMLKSRNRTTFTMVEILNKFGKTL